MEESRRRFVALFIHTRKKKYNDGDSMALDDILEEEKWMMTQMNSMQTSSRTMYSRPKPNIHYWDRVVISWSDEDYKRHLRLKRETFIILCDEMRPLIEKIKTNYKEPVRPDCRMAIGLWRLATGSTYREIGENFGLGKSTAFEITKEVCSLLSTQLLGKYVKLPANTHMAAQSFCMEKGLPNCIGAIDGCHIPIPKPPVNGADFWNRKNFYSINMQALVDHRGRYLDVVIGWPGKAHDARILRNSELYRRGSQGALFPESDFMIGEQKIPYYIIGDAAYPLESWIVKPFRRRENPEEEIFNTKLSKARMVVEKSFGRLKARWRCLLKRCDACPRYAKMMIASSVILHNVCEMHGDFLEEYIPVENDEEDDAAISEMTVTGCDVRNALKSLIVGF